MAFQVGIIGMGVVSGTHIRALQQLEQVALVAVCDIKEEKRTQVPEGARFYTDYREMLVQEKLDAVHICLPHYLHYEAAQSCASNGVHVLCEKPVVMNREQLVKMCMLEAQYGVTVAVCMQNRLNRTFEELRHRIDSGAYGRLLGVKGVAMWSRPESYYEAAPWRGSMQLAGGGCMINQAIHTLDQMLLLGGQVTSVKGQICNLLNYDIEVEDTATANITFENGAHGLFYATIGYIKNSSIELQAVCEKGVFTIKDFALWFAETENDSEKTLLVKDNRLPGSKSYYGASHCELIAGFYEVLSGKSSHYVKVEQAGVPVLVINMIRKSSTENKEIAWEEFTR